MKMADILASASYGGLRTPLATVFFFGGRLVTLFIGRPVGGFR